MSSYQGAAGQQDRAKAIVGVVAVHAALAFVILTGLNVKLVTEAVDHLKTFSLENIPPPLPVPTPPKLKPRPQRVKEAAGRSREKGAADPCRCTPTRHSRTLAGSRRKDRGFRQRQFDRCCSCG